MPPARFIVSLLLLMGDEHGQGSYEGCRQEYDRQDEGSGWEDDGRHQDASRRQDGPCCRKGAKRHRRSEGRHEEVIAEGADWLLLNDLRVLPGVGWSSKRRWRARVSRVGICLRPSSPAARERPPRSAVPPSRSGVASEGPQMIAQRLSPERANEPQVEAAALLEQCYSLSRGVLSRPGPSAGSTSSATFPCSRQSSWAALRTSRAPWARSSKPLSEVRPTSSPSTASTWSRLSSGTARSVERTSCPSTDGSNASAFSRSRRRRAAWTVDCGASCEAAIKRRSAGRTVVGQIRRAWACLLSGLGGQPGDCLHGARPRSGVTCDGVPKLVHEVFSVRDFRPNGRHAQALGDPVQRYASLSQLSGIGFESVRDPLGRHRRRTRLVACCRVCAVH